MNTTNYDYNQQNDLKKMGVGEERKITDLLKLIRVINGVLYVYGYATHTSIYFVPFID